MAVAVIELLQVADNHLPTIYYEVRSLEIALIAWHETVQVIYGCKEVKK